MCRPEEVTLSEGAVVVGSWGVILSGAAVFVALLFVSAPYGRHARRGWGPSLSARLGWVLMESPSALLFAGVYLRGPDHAGEAPLVLLLMWELHYLHRALVFPFRMRMAGRRMPLSVVGMGALFNVVNASLNGRWVSALGAYPQAWLGGPRFLLGLVLFLAGLAANWHSDRVLAALREGQGEDYAIPRRGLFGLVSCPNYLGEIVEWTGWAVATWSLPGLAFAIFTAANLVPRALAHHRWYRVRFPDYPPDRRALVPFLL